MRMRASDAAPMAKVTQFVMPLQDALHQADRLLDESAAAGIEAEDLGQLADQDGERNAVQVAQADRLGEQVGDEAELRQARDDAQGAGEHREHPGQRDQELGVARGQRHDGRGNNGGQRGIRTQHENAAWAKDGVRDQWKDRGVQAIDGWQPGRFGVAHADRNENRREHKPGHDVFRQPGPLIGAHAPSAGIQRLAPFGCAARVIGLGPCSSMVRSPVSVSCRSRRDASAGNRRTQRMVVALVLRGIGSGKVGDCLVEDRSFAEITCDGDAVAGPGMRRGPISSRMPGRTPGAGA